MSSLSATTEQETITVKGTVSDEEGPLPGVNVVLKGTKIGTSTDFEGNYVFPKKLKKGDILVFTHISMESNDFSGRRLAAAAAPSATATGSVQPRASVTSIRSMSLTVKFINFLCLDRDGY